MYSPKSSPTAVASVAVGRLVASFLAGGSWLLDGDVAEGRSCFREEDGCSVELLTNKGLKVEKDELKGFKSTLSTVSPLCNCFTQPCLQVSLKCSVHHASNGEYSSEL